MTAAYCDAAIHCLYCYFIFLVNKLHCFRKSWVLDTLTPLHLSTAKRGNPPDGVDNLSGIVL